MRLLVELLAGIVAAKMPGHPVRVVSTVHPRPEQG
jgi:hypothetical protein